MDQLRGSLFYLGNCCGVIHQTLNTEVDGGRNRTDFTSAIGKLTGFQFAHRPLNMVKSELFRLKRKSIAHGHEVESTEYSV